MNDNVLLRSKVSNKMRIERERLISFKAFPQSERLNCLRLAQNGFYACGPGNRVACFSCGIVNKDWPENESIAQTHRRLSPLCKFVRERENNTSREEVANAVCFVHERVKIQEREENDSLPLPNIGPIDRNVAGMSVTEKETEQFPFLQPIHAIHKEKAERLNTFRTWKFGDIVQPEMLADAGFFYTGNFILTSNSPADFP